MKDRVFATTVNDIGELGTRIHDAIARIKGEMLTRSLQEYEYRLDSVRATNGGGMERCTRATKVKSKSFS